MTKLPLLLFCLALASGAWAGPQDRRSGRGRDRFFHGRRRLGMLPPPPPPLDKSELVGVQELWFTQKLDHLNTANTATWQQRYFLNDQYYQQGGPIFVLIGGEGPISTGWMSGGDWVKNARLFGALLLQLEHRYYGDSHPTPDASTANLQWLSSEQALADLANFIMAMKIQQNIQTAKVIIFGGSYSGSLSAWFRLKYPHIADGAIASSAPVVATEDFYQYLEVVAASMEYYRPGCSGLVKAAVQTIDDMIKAGLKYQVEQIFDTCTPLNPDDPYDMAMFYGNLVDPWAEVTQYNGQSLHVPTVAELCDIMNDPTMGDLVHRLAIITASPEGCSDHDFTETVNVLNQTSWDSDAVSGGSRQWLYQSCTEFGFFQTTDSQNQPFGGSNTLKFNEDLYCKYIFNMDPSKVVKSSVAQSNQLYGADGLKVTKIVLPNGSVDPWHSLGIVNSIGPLADSIFITGTSHCQDMMGTRSSDSPQLLYARSVITSRIAQWLNS